MSTVSEINDADSMRDAYARLIAEQLVNGDEPDTHYVRLYARERDRAAELRAQLSHEVEQTP